MPMKNRRSLPITEKFTVNPPIVNIHSGMKARASMVLMKVMVMDMLMSPFRSSVQKLDPVPPGQQPSTNRPSLPWKLLNFTLIL